MNRNHVFVSFGVVFLTLGLLVALGGGCSCAGPRWDFGDWVTPSIDGVKLPHKATLHFSSKDPPKRFALSLGPASIVVEGDATVAGVEAEFEVREKTPGDASLVASADGVEAKSASGAPVLVTSAKVRVPPGTAVDASTGVGAVTVAGISGAAEVSAKAATGDVDVHGLSGVPRVVVKAGVGDVRVKSIAGSESLTCELGTGDVRVTDVNAPACRLKSGVGDVRAERSTFDHLYAHSGVGDVRLVGCTYKTKDVGTGVGDVTETK